MPRLIVTEGAATGMRRCRLFLVDKSETSANRAAQAIKRSLLRLASSPEIGRPMADRVGLRELLIPFGDSGYIALYRFEPADDAVYVLAFRHLKEAGY